MQQACKSNTAMKQSCLVIYNIVYTAKCNHIFQKV